MARPEVLLGVMERASLGELEGAMDDTLRRGCRPVLIDLLPGCLRPEFIAAARSRGLEVLDSGRFFDTAQRRETEYAAAEIAIGALGTVADRLVLRGLRMDGIFQHIYYWYNIRPALIGLAVLRGLTEQRRWTGLTLLGGDDLRAGVLAEDCRRRGLAFRAPGRRAEAYSRRLRYSRRLTSRGVVLGPRAAHYLSALRDRLRFIGSTPRIEPGEILVVPVTPADSANWLAVADRLPAELRWAVAADDAALFRSYPDEIDRYNLRALAGTDHLRPWIRAYRRLEGLVEELPGLIRGFTWRGCELDELLRVWMLHLIRLLLWRMLPMIAGLERLLTKLEPALVVALSERDVTALTAFQLARMKGVPSLALESHDMVYGTPLFGRPSADRMALGGQASREVYLAHGARPEQLVVTGQPVYDRLVEFGRRDALPLKRRFTDEKRLAVFFSQPTDVTLPVSLKRRFLEGARELDALDGWRVLIKPHPREEKHSLRELLAEEGLQPASVLTEPGVDLYELLAAADLVVTAFSTVGVEALLMGRPVVCFVQHDTPPPLEYVESAAVLRVSGGPELIESVAGLLDDPTLRAGLERGRRAYLERYEAAWDGGAARRTAELITEMIADGR